MAGLTAKCLGQLSTDRKTHWVVALVDAEALGMRKLSLLIFIE